MRGINGRGITVKSYLSSLPKNTHIDIVANNTYYKGHYIPLGVAYGYKDIDKNFPDKQEYSSLVKYNDYKKTLRKYGNSKIKYVEFSKDGKVEGIKVSSLPHYCMVCIDIDQEKADNMAKSYAVNYEWPTIEEKKNWKETYFS